MSMKRFGAAVLSLAMALSLFAGCGSTPAESTAAPETSSETAPAEGEKEIIDIAVFEGGFGREYWLEMMDKYTASHPNVEFKSTISPKVGEIIRPRVVAGDSPDIIVLSDDDTSGLILSMIKDHALADISDVFDGPAYDKDETLRNLMKKGYLESRKYSPYGDGKIYLSPRDYSATGFVYNKAYFKKMGWEVPETWDEFFALGDKAKAEGRALVTYPGIYPKYWDNVLLPAIADEVGMEGMQKIFDYEEGSFNNPDVLKVLKQFEKIADGGYLMEGSMALNHTQSQTEFMMGKALFIPTGMWVVNEMKDSPREEEFEFGIMAPPVFEKGDQRFLYANYAQYCIPADAKNIEGAKDFLRFLYTEESARVMAEKCNTVLCMEGALDAVKDIVDPNLAELYHVFDDTYPIIPGFATLPAGSKVNVLETMYGNAMTKMLGGEITAEEYADIVEKAFAQIRDEQEKLG